MKALSSAGSALVFHAARTAAPSSIAIPYRAISAAPPQTSHPPPRPKGMGMTTIPSAKIGSRLTRFAGVGAGCPCPAVHGVDARLRQDGHLLRAARGVGDYDTLSRGKPLPCVPVPTLSGLLHNLGGVRSGLLFDGKPQARAKHCPMVAGGGAYRLTAFPKPCGLLANVAALSRW